MSCKNIDPLSADNSEQADHQQDWHATATHCKSVPARRDKTQLENRKSAKWKGQIEVTAANQLFNLQLNTQVTKNPSSHTKRSINENLSIRMRSGQDFPASPLKGSSSRLAVCSRALYFYLTDMKCMILPFLGRKT